MELELSDDQQALQESVRAVRERECPISLVRSVVEEHKHAKDLWSRMVELDWPALAVPEQDGGLGLGFVELAVVCEQLGCVICPAPFLATATQFVPALLHAGSAEQRHRFLGAVARAGAVGTLAGVMLAAGGSSVSPNIENVALLAFPAIILGGLDSPGGAIVGGVIIGITQNLLPPLLLTQGGPGNATWTPVLYMYEQAFQYDTIGYALAIAFVLFVVSLVLAILTMRFLRTDGDTRRRVA